MDETVATYRFSSEESTLIATALKSSDPWMDPGVKSVRRKIKDFHLDLIGEFCCHCQRNLHGEFQMCIDVEHILPSSKFPDLTFEMWNLSVSCKRCNMHIKGADVNFLDEEHSNFFSSAHYRIIHPHFDDLEQHLIREARQRGRQRLVKYIIQPDSKGAYSYNYFRLSELEMDSYDKAQGAAPIGEVDEEIKQRVTQLPHYAEATGSIPPLATTN